MLLKTRRIPALFFLLFFFLQKRVFVGAVVIDAYGVLAVRAMMRE